MPAGTADRGPERTAAQAIPGPLWRRIFDYRKMLTLTALKGIYRYHEFIGPVIPLEAVVYLGEGHTPLVAANGTLRDKAGAEFFQKRRPEPERVLQGPGHGKRVQLDPPMILREVSEILAICASTGDTSATAALYGSYLAPRSNPPCAAHGKVTQQLGSPSAAGRQFEIPGVRRLHEGRRGPFRGLPCGAANSKNAWRISARMYATKSPRISSTTSRRWWWLPSAMLATSRRSCALPPVYEVGS